MANITSVTLITHTYTSDAIGQNIATNVEKTVIGSKSSVSSSEFFEAGLRGLQPQFKVEIWEGEYNGATEIKVDNTIYSVYRTYKNDSGKIELYVEKRVG